VALEEKTPPTNAESDQAERNAGARRELARAAGMAIHRTTAILDGGSTFAEGASMIDIALVTFAARGRRLLQAAFRLIDASEESEAAPLLRVLHEYVIVTRWLLLDPEKHAPGWALDDLRGRAVAAEKTDSTSWIRVSAGCWSALRSRGRSSIAAPWWRLQGVRAR
jgi:hypothetical protein